MRHPSKLSNILDIRDNAAAITATNILNKRNIKISGNILTELEKNIKDFAGGNLRYFNKNWYDKPRISISWI